MKKYFFALLLVISCRNSNNVTYDDIKSTEIVIESKLDNKINLSDIFSHVSYVKLESNRLSAIGSIGKMIVHDNQFYINDLKTSRIILFDKNGKYTFQISKAGRGPGEYVDVEDFLVDSASNRIVILDDGNQKVLTYDKTGYFINERKHSLWANEFSKLSDNSYLFFFNNYPNKPDADDAYNVLITDSLFNIKESFLPIGHLLGLKVGEQNFLQKYGDGANVIVPFDNHIYYVTANSYTIKYTINFTNYRIPESIFEEYLEEVNANKNSRTQALLQFIQKLNEGDYINNIQNYFENHEYLTFQYRISHKGQFTVFVNKSTGDTHIGIAENDIDYGLYGIPIYLLKDTLYTYFTANELKERINLIDTKNLPLNSQYTKLRSLSESVNEEDNPIIAKFQLK